MGTENKTYRASASLTRPANTTAYAAGDVVAGDTIVVPISFEGLGDFVDDGVLIDSAVICSSANQATKLSAKLLLFDTSHTVDADNAAYTPLDADMQRLVGIVTFADTSWIAGDATVGAGGNAACVASNLGIVTNGGTVYGVLVAQNAYTPVSGETITINLFGRK